MGDVLELDTTEQIEGVEEEEEAVVSQVIAIYRDILKPTLKRQGQKHCECGRTSQFMDVP